ncbi:TIGR00156 family protein [Pseudoxanthomonas jiangsuensis]|uniref:NirD/YgiW/YdeI family stress tolerance protein n=1 Tax=Pseudoxanthomonas jiangsuensis TaxID=619688 RepID=UPI001391F28B|nr:NirD/YgiW/YdeI family stress tolerance protein [Pseudoxanthomonas jiangsuensis]KAF1697245.1 TIGR00156 family protein [Pseudoxanthomonas jiangsuensis]
MKYKLAAIALMVAMGGSAHAWQVNTGGYTGPGVAVTRVADAKESGDDVHVRLRGTIRQHLGGDRYIFADATGSIHVDIDADLWMGQTVGPKDEVELEGEVDKDWTSIEIDVDRIRKM